jgi:hypothetical protein
MLSVTTEEIKPMITILTQAPTRYYPNGVCGAFTGYLSVKEIPLACNGERLMPIEVIEQYLSTGHLPTQGSDVGIDTIAFVPQTVEGKVVGWAFKMMWVATWDSDCHVSLDYGIMSSDERELVLNGGKAA